MFSTNEATPIEQVSQQRHTIRKVQQICEARIAYNQALRAFLETSNEADRIAFLKKNMLSHDKYSQEDLEVFTKNAQFIDSSYQRFLIACERDCRPYREALHLIEKNRDHQTVIDQLYLKFIIEYQAASHEDSKFKEARKAKENKYDIVLESPFFRNIRDLLEEGISHSTTHFLSLHTLELTKQPGDVGSLATWALNPNRVRKICNTFDSFAQEKDTLIESLSQYPELSYFRDLFDSFDIKRLSISKSLKYDIGVCWLQSLSPIEYLEHFKEISEIDLELKELNKVKEQCQRFINQRKNEQERLASIEAQKLKKPSKKQAPPKKHTQKKEATEKKQSGADIKSHDLENSSSNVETILRTPSIVAESQPVLPVIQTVVAPTLTLAQKNALQYKQEVLAERNRKQAEELALKQSKIEQNLQAMRDQQARARRGEELLETIAFQRLHGLNDNNLERLQSILSRTDRSMRYTDVQALIGKEPYQLQGAIENANGGSHRKVTLDAVPDAPDFLGYFDEPTPEEVQNIPPPEGVQDTAITPVLFSTTAHATITGGIYRGHGVAHSAKLTPIIKMMLATIFSQAGITEERLARFREVKATCKSQGIAQPTVAELQAAVAIERDRVGVRP